MGGGVLHPLLHLELRTADLPRACGYYTRMFGWRVETVRLDSGSYLEVGLAESVGGGVVEVDSGAAWLPYVGVSDINRATARARELGGDVRLRPREGPAGWRAVVAAPDGSEVALWQQKS